MKTLYLEHRTTHTGEKLYYCAECGKGFGFASAYNYHVRVHLREKGMEVDKDRNALYHYCDHCGKRFTCPRILRRHIKVKHLGYPTECVCEQCGAKFKNKDRLLEHRNINHRTDDRCDSTRRMVNLLFSPLPPPHFLLQVPVQDLPEEVRQ